MALVLFAASARSQPDDYSAPELPWFTIETRHFTVSWHEGAERTGRTIAKIAEEVYGPITSLYRHEPDTKVHIFVKDISDYSNGAAYFFNNKIEVWATPLDFELRGTHNWLRNVISHEFTHIVQMQAAMKWGRRLPALTFQWFRYERERRSDVLYGYPNTLVSYPLPGIIVPPWMAEGTAQYNRPQLGYEHWDSHRDMILRCYALSDSMLTWSEMSAFGKTSLGNESVYNAGYNLTRYIAKTYGEQAVVAITRAMSKPLVFTVDGAIRDVLGISGRQLYDAWAAAVTREYRSRIAPVLERRVEGTVIADVGFGNLHPAFSPDGGRVAYVSNKKSDYFGQSSIYVYDRATQQEIPAAAGARSNPAWTPDGRNIIYAKYNTPSVYGHLYYDLYQFNLASLEETRITTGLRAHSPAVSPDGRTIVFCYEHDGTVNLGAVDSNGGNFRAMTAFSHGEQCFSPSWSPDGSHVLFAYAPRTIREIARINPDGSGMRVLASDSAVDFRDPVYSKDGAWIYYASDAGGIFNIRRRKADGSGVTEQLTNVVGGAFMPAVAPDGALAYSLYTAGGYKIALLAQPSMIDSTGRTYLPAAVWTPPNDPKDDGWDWTALQHFDDETLPAVSIRPYKTIFQSMMLFPVLRIDQYNPENKGLALFKPGLMLYSSDILGRLEMLASGAINIKGERDLYASFTYKDRLPLFADLGLFPAVTLEVFNVTRGTRSSIALPLDTVGVDVSFNLLEFAIRLKHNIVSNHTQFEALYRHSRYTSTVGSFRNPETDGLISARDNLYLIGNDLGIALRHHDMVPARDGEINPTGLRLGLFYDYEFNRFNPNGNYDVDFSTGMIVPRYTHYNFHRLEATLLLASRLPGWAHALSLRLRVATIFGPPVDEFFNFYAGGVTGMQGYSYYALGGNELYSATVTYRFPIVQSLDFRLGHLLFDKLYAGVFYDIGDATARADQLTARTAKQDAGFELRLESFSFSMYPTRIFFSGAYGLSDFTRVFNFQPVRYGREWKWYVGVLFGFDLSDK